MPRPSRTAGPASRHPPQPPERRERAGLHWGPHCVVNRGAGWGCGREVACIWPGTEKAGPLSAASTSGPREGPGPLVGPVHTAPTWGQATGCGALGQARTWPLPAPRTHTHPLSPPSCPASPNANAVETEAVLSGPCRNRSGGTGGPGPGAAPLTRHRDKSDLFILVKKTKTKTTWHCIWLDP